MMMATVMFFLCVLLALAMFFRTTHLGYLDGKFPGQKYGTPYILSMGLGSCFATMAPVFWFIPILKNYNIYTVLFVVAMVGLLWGFVLIVFGENSWKKGEKDRPVQRQTI